MFEIVDPSLIGGFVGMVLFAGILACLELGRRLGKRAVAAHGPSALPSTESLETAVFALLGLMIAFTFSGALSRLDIRRGQVVDEANAIGTGYLRVDLLPAATQPRLRESFREYTDARIATYRKLPDLQGAREELAHAQQLQSDIWAQAVAAARLPDARPGTDLLVMPALNQMFDLATVRVAATQMHPPIIVYVMLVALAFASALLAGFQSAAEASHRWVHHVGFGAIVAFTVYVILDMEYPRTGWIRIDAIDQVMVGTRNGMK
jgi:hypothetical protein